MHTITFTCETITPMFLSGADGVTPELRAPSIKGALRFWWRAMNGHLSLEELKRQEGEIFGDTSKRSSILLYPINILTKQEDRISGTPHHRNGYCKTNRNNCFYRNGVCGKSKLQNALFYNFSMKVGFNINKITNEDIIRLVKTTFLLGGIGKRVRRGFGSVQITKIDNDVCFISKNEIENFLLTLNRIESNINYPYFKKVEIGKKHNDYNELLVAIGETTHAHADNHGSIGFAKGQERFASPIYVSVIRDENRNLYPIITTLNTAPKRPIENLGPQQNFINALKNN